MIRYIGDLSKNDAQILKEYAEQSYNILEFGCGGSTQILSEYCLGKVLSIDTSFDWINKTKSNIDLLNIRNIPSFKLYEEFVFDSTEIFDFIFDDSIDSLRGPFALAAWKYLKVGGFIAFHDTRIEHHQENILQLMKWNYNEINSVLLNHRNSNITIVEKKPLQNYVNWNIEEGREEWEAGRGVIPLDIFKK